MKSSPEIKTKNTPSTKAWHSIPLAEVLSLIKTNPERGLEETEAKLRLTTWGKNRLPEGKKTTALQMFFGQFTSPLVYILLIAAALTFWIKEYSDMAVILIVVVINAFIGLWQEYRANEIFEKLKAIVRVEALTVREGKIEVLDSEELVPGDIIILKGGSKVPADARLISVSNLEINEALLTGESKATKKNLGEVQEKALVGDRLNMVFTGTVIERGEGKAVIVGTASKTEIGQISLLTQSTEDEDSPLQIRMGKLGKFLTEVFVAISLAIFLLGLAEGDSLIEMFKTTIAVAVAAIPEGLPAAISIILAVSSQKILNRKGLVRKLIAAETLGSTSVICTDKTGTLTYGRMKVEQIYCDKNVEGQFHLAMALANEAILETDHSGKIQVRGEATDKAKLEKFLEGGKKLEDVLIQLPRIALMPFEEVRKTIASFHRDKNRLTIFVSGAPEKILEASTLGVTEKQKIRETYENLAKRGFRMIAMAVKNGPLPPEASSWSIEQMNAQIKAITYLRLAAIRDPIRQDVRETMALTRKAGIKVLMVTGDHILTARAIGLELGFRTSDSAVINGEDLDKMSEKDLEKAIAKIEIVARVNPEHKMRIIKAWQNRGAVVAMTGDGVNDAPALKAADIGIAVGSGTDVAKEASDLVLLDDGFNTITAAIAEGRTGFANIRKATVTVMCNAFTEIVLIASTLVTHSPFPLTAIQILWVNIVEDGLPVLSMAFEPTEDGVMKTKPTPPNEPILDRESNFLIFAVSIFSDLTLVGIFLYLFYSMGWDLVKAQTLVFVATATPTLINIFSFKSLRVPLTKIKIFNNRFLLFSVAIGFILMIVALYIPFFNKFLKTVPLALGPALLCFLVFPFYKLLLIEIAKWWFNRSNSLQLTLQSSGGK